MEDKLEEYLRAVPLAGNPALSMWGMANMMARCDSGVADCVDFYAIPANVFDTTVLCDGDLDMAWRNFRQLYLGVKQQLLYNLINNPTGCTPSNPLFTSVPKNTDIFSAGHTPQFSNDITTTLDQNGLTAINQAGGNPNHLGQATAQSQQKLDSFYTENCRAYVQQWTLRLQPCAYDPELLADTLLPRLLALCRMACDVDHPFGASTLPVGVTYTPAGTDYVFTSFNNIIDAFNALHPPTPGVVDCNAELITEPEPYDKQPVYSEKPIFTKPSDCECTLINDLYNTYLLANQEDASFASYLQRTQQITMSNADLNTLRNMCNNSDVNGPGTAACVWLPQPIFLPASMQCNTGQVCASCTLVDSLYQDYIEAYPDQVPEIGELEDTTQTKINTLFSSYMNNRLGFGMQAWEYLQFMAACDSSEIVDTVNCIDRPVGNLFLFSGTGSLSDIQSTSDDGFILAGVTTGSGAGGEDGIIIKTNGTGLVQWTKAYGGTDDDNFTRVKATSDNGYIAVGTTKSGRYPQGEMLIVKFNSSGATEWTRNIGFNTIFGERGYDIIETSGGGYAALGIYDQHTGNGEFMVARLDDGGDLEWVRRFGTSRLQPDTCTPFGPDSLTFTATPAYGLVQRGDTLVIAGTAYDSNLGNRYFGVIYQVSAFDGELIRNWHYSDISNNEKSTWFRDIHATDVGYTVLVNNANHYSTDSLQAAVVKLSFSGEVVDYKRFNLPSGSNKITSSGMYPTSDGGYLLAQTGNNDPHIFWQQVDAEGVILFETESAIPGDQLIGRVLQNGNNSFTAVGVNNGNKPLLVDLFPTTPTGCYDNTVTIGLTSPVLSQINWALEGSEFMVPVYTDTTLIATILSTTDSSLICPGNGNCYTVYQGPRLCGKSQPVFPPVAIDSTTICSDSTFFAVSKGTELSKVYKDSLIGSFEKRYNEVCLQAYLYESFTMTHNKAEYHYTLYYYDQAGNLVRTVPPAGVNPNYDSTWLESVKEARVEGAIIVPEHTMAMNYRYNTLNQMVAQKSPDGGLSHFWYDRLGRLAVSQNAKQEDSMQYSYTRYDTIGRIVEVGQLQSDTAMIDVISRNQVDLEEWITDAYETAEQITKTMYDYEYAPLAPVMAAKHLRNRVAWTALYNLAEHVDLDSAATATYYSYDVLGNVDTIIHDFNFGVMAQSGNRFKKLVYEYDLISGKVNRLAYQPRQPDAFYHMYFYDAENRITHVQTSWDSVNWDNEAFYTYYDDDVLARTVLGEQQVQGINYAYTLQGWLKSVNPTIHNGVGYLLQPDGSTGSIVAKNEYEILLNYYRSDYVAISSAAPPQIGLADTLGVNHYRELFNGNFSSIGVNITALTSPLLYNYQYDQLNRLVAMDAWERTGGIWSDISLRPDFQERISYDPNGNILKYKRNGNNTFASGQIGMDSLTYKYIMGTNRLDHVRDSISSVNYAVDVDDQAAANYGYDAVGNMVSDDAEGIEKISWTAYGNISSIFKSNGTNITYTYDAFGNRISKIVGREDTTVTTWYVRDMQGNVMSVYTKGNDSIQNGDLTQTELHLYGSNRLGMLQCQTNMENLTAPNETSLPFLGYGYNVIFVRGIKLYELKNHLGNVLATISEKRFGISLNDSTVDHFKSDLISAQDYYPFGMVQVGRKFGQGLYRYGFNGQEVSREIEDNSYTAEHWQYDSRLGRRWNVDPIPIVPISPYATLYNNPINYTDIKGDSAIVPSPTSNTDKNYTPWMSLLLRTPGNLLSAANKRFLVNIFQDQRTSNSTGRDLNLDFYKLDITKLPPGFTAGELFTYIRTNFERYVDGTVSTLEPYDGGEAKLWNSSSPNSSILRFRGIKWGRNVDDADVLTTNYTYSGDYASWTFRPISNYNFINPIYGGDKGHPLGGNREFGIQKNGSNYLFYIQGIDRLWSGLDETMVGRVNDGEFFKMADKLWKQVMSRISVTINNMGGQSSFNADGAISKRIDYNTEVSEEDKTKIRNAGN